MNKQDDAHNRALLQKAHHGGPPGPQNFAQKIGKGQDKVEKEASAAKPELLLPAGETVGALLVLESRVLGEGEEFVHAGGFHRKPSSAGRPESKQPAKKFQPKRHGGRGKGGGRHKGHPSVRRMEFYMVYRELKRSPTSILLCRKGENKESCTANAFCFALHKLWEVAIIVLPLPYPEIYS